MDNMKPFHIVVNCSAVYNSVIMVPAESSHEEALQYAMEHLDNVTPYGLDVMGDEVLDAENCAFEKTVLCIKDYVEDGECFWSAGNYYKTAMMEDSDTLRVYNNFNELGRIYLANFHEYFRYV